MSKKGLPSDVEFHFTPAHRAHDRHTLELHSGGAQLGELFWAPRDGDISGVNTHPQFLRRGVATRFTRRPMS